MKNLGRMGLVLAFGVGFLILGLELVFQRVFTSEHLVYQEQLDLPRTFRPSTSLRAKTKDYETLFRTNERGYKDRSFQEKKAPGTFRVLILGGSYAEGLAVSTKNQVGEVLETIGLSRGEKMDVVTFALSGYGVSHQIRLYEKIGRRLDPDLVVSFFQGQSIRDNIGGDAFHFLENGVLREYEAREPSPRGVVSQVLDSLRVLESFHAMMQMVEPSPPRRIFFAPIDQSDQSPEDSYSKDLFGVLVRTLKREVVDEDNRKLMAVITSRDLEIMEAPYENEFARSVYRGAQIPVVDMHQRLMDFYNNSGKLPYIARHDLHWNEWGHRQAALALWTAIQKMRMGEPVGSNEPDQIESKQF